MVFRRTVSKVSEVEVKACKDFVVDFDTSFVVVATNIYPGVAPKQIRPLFEECGQIDLFVMPAKDNKNEHYGFAYIRYFDEASCDKAVGRLDGDSIGRSRKSTNKLEVNYYSAHGTLNNLDRQAAEFIVLSNVADQQPASILKKTNVRTTVAKSVTFNYDNLGDIRERETSTATYTLSVPPNQ